MKTQNKMLEEAIQQVTSGKKQNLQEEGNAFASVDNELGKAVSSIEKATELLAKLKPNELNDMDAFEDIIESMSDLQYVMDKLSKKLNVYAPKKKG